MDIFLFLIAQAHSLPVQVTYMTLPPMLPTDKIVVSIEHEEESIQNANYASAIVLELTSCNTGKIGKDEVDGSTIVTITDDRYDASLDEH